MSGTPSRDLELRLIVSLCRELAKLRLNVAMSDARPAAMIHSPARLSIIVDDSAEYFTWGTGQHRHQHPVTDPVGAARLINYEPPPVVM